VFFDDEVVGIFEAIVRAVFPFSYLNFASTRVSAAGGGVAYESGFEYSDEVLFVGRGPEFCGKNIFGQNRRATSEGGVVEAFVSVYYAGGHVVMMVGRCVEVWNGVTYRLCANVSIGLLPNSVVIVSHRPT
jgi:hypothetical protein